MELSNNISDKLIITFDKTDSDEAVLLVSREIFDIMYSTKLEVINEFKGRDAIALYNFLKTKED